MINVERLKIEIFNPKFVSVRHPQTWKPFMVLSKSRAEME